MGSRGLRALVAVVVLLVLALWLWRPGKSERAVDPKVGVEAAPGPHIDLSPVESAREVVEHPASAPAKPALSFGDASAETFEFELTVLPIDASGRPVMWSEVRIGLEMQALALLEKTEWNGELHAKWRGSEPTEDLVLEAGPADDGYSTLRHLHLVAGRAEIVRLAVDKNSIPILGGLEVLQGAFRPLDRGSTLDEGVRFERDDVGSGVFVDPSLVRVPPSKAVPLLNAVDQLRFQVFVQPMLSIGPDRTVTELFKDNTRVEVTALDELGAPIPSALVTVRYHDGATASNAGPHGRAFLVCSPGPVRVIAGGGQYEAVWQDTEVEKGETRLLELRCPKLERTRLRLFDAGHLPLAGWHLESRDARILGETVDRGDTDAQGRIEIVIDPAGRTDLLARPPGASAMPKMRIDARNLDRTIENEIMLAPESQPAQLAATILTTAANIEARLWNVDTDEGMRLPVADDPAGAGRKVTASAIVPGTYVLEIGASCTSWKRIGPFHVAGGQVLDVGTWTLDPPATLKVTGIPSNSYLKVMARARVNGLWLVGEDKVSSTDDLLTLTPGEWTITLHSPEGTTPQLLLGPRVIKAESGHETTLDFGGASGPR